MSEKETSLVESVEEQTTQQEESKEFDVNAFLGKGENEEVDTISGTFCSNSNLTGWNIRRVLDLLGSAFN